MSAGKISVRIPRMTQRYFREAERQTDRETYTKTNSERESDIELDR